MGAPCFRAGFCSKTIIPDSEEHPLASSRAVPKAVLRWIRAYTIDPDPIEGTTVTIEGLTNGTGYSHRVRSKNRLGASDWSAHVDTTPKQRLAAPTLTYVEPLPLRRAHLKWTDDANPSDDTEYEVQISAPPLTQTTPPNWEFVATVTSVDDGHVIDLDNVLTKRILPTGFADPDHDYFEIRIVAKDVTNAKLDSYPSRTIRIIDDPLLQTGGRAYAPNSDGEAVLQWATVSNGSNYSVRYRVLGDGKGIVVVPGVVPIVITTAIDHTDPDWPKGGNWPYHNGEVNSETPDSPGKKTITGLDEDELYAFQINYEIGGILVFSARDAYVWPSVELPSGRVATFPSFGHHNNRVFEYIICDETFPAADRAEWVKLIKHAFGQWQEATSD